MELTVVRSLVFPLIVGLAASGCEPHGIREVPVYEAVFAEVADRAAPVFVEETPPREHELHLGGFEALGFENVWLDLDHVAADFGRVPVHVVSERELDSLFGQGTCTSQWERFFARYPGAKALVGVSHVYFRSRDEAMVYVEKRTGCAHGVATILVLEARDGRWKVKKHVVAWMS